MFGLIYNTGQCHAYMLYVKDTVCSDVIKVFQMF